MQLYLTVVELMGDNRFVHTQNRHWTVVEHIVMGTVYI